VVMPRGIWVIPFCVPDEQNRSDDVFLLHHRQGPIDRIPGDMRVFPGDATIDGIGVGMTSCGLHGPKNRYPLRCNPRPLFPKNIFCPSGFI